MSSSIPIFSLNLPQQDREKIREERRLKRIESKEFKKAQLQLEKEENDKLIKEHENQIEYFKTEIKNINKKLKTASGLHKNKLFVELKQLKYDIAIARINILQLDRIFMIRNTIRTKMCPKVVNKGKVCKYENCTFAHQEEELRKPKCLYHMFGICKYSDDHCLNDHSKDEIPIIPDNPKVEPQTTEEVEKVKDIVLLSSTHSSSECVKSENEIINDLINEGKHVVLNSEIPSYKYCVNVGVTKLFCNKKSEEVKEILDLLK
jgi:hypothetical protein